MIFIFVLIGKIFIIIHIITTSYFMLSKYGAVMVVITDYIKLKNGLPKKYSLSDDSIQAEFIIHT